MNLGHLLTAWTIRFALLFYVAALGMLLLRGADVKRCNTTGWRTIRITWTVGCLFFVSHVIAAFQFYHHWSHDAAFADTAKQTKEMMGWEFGGGIFVSYLFLVLWISDVFAWWLEGERYLRRPAWLNLPLQFFLLFIAFNGTVIFKGGIIRAAGIGASIGLAAILIRRLVMRRSLSNESGQVVPGQPQSSIRSFQDAGTRYE